MAKGLTLRIAILTDDYLPASTRNHARMLHELAIEFSKRQHEVIIITPGAYGQTSLIDFYKFEQIQIWRFRSPRMRNVSKFQRLIAETLLPFYAINSMTKLQLNCEFDLCVNYSPTIFWGVFARWLKARGAFVYLVLRDFFPQWIIDEGLIGKKSIAAIYLRFFEKLNYRSSNIIAVQSPANLDIFNKIAPYHRKNVEVLYNWAKQPLKKPSLSYGKALLKSLKIEEKIVLFYGGNIGHAQDMRNIVRLAKNLCSIKQAHLLLVGQGDEYTLVEELIKKLKLNNITLLPSINQNDYLSILYSIHIGLFSLSATHTTHNFPGKLLGYMAAGLPILGSANRNNDIIDLMNKSGAGLVSINGHDQEFFENANKLINLGKKRTKFGDSGKKLLKKTFSVEKAASQMISAFNRVRSL